DSAHDDLGGDGYDDQGGAEFIGAGRQAPVYAQPDSRVCTQADNDGEQCQEELGAAPFARDPGLIGLGRTPVDTTQETGDSCVPVPMTVSTAGSEPVERVDELLVSDGLSLGSSVGFSSLGFSSLGFPS